MKPYWKYTNFILTFIILLPFLACTQNKKSKEPLNSKLLTAAREIMSSVGTCALITVDKDQRPRVRVMDPFKPEPDFTVWFGTNPKSRKVDQIKKNPKVTLYYLETGNTGYVMIQGTAQLVNDEREKETRWKDGWEAFYPNKPIDYLLIKVTPNWIEVVSYAHNILGDPETWEPAKIVFGLAEPN